MESSGSAIVDFGRFLTGFFVVMGIGMFGLIFILKVVRRKRKRKRG